MLSFVLKNAVPLAGVVDGAAVIVSNCIEIFADPLKDAPPIFLAVSKVLAVPLNPLLTTSIKTLLSEDKSTLFDNFNVLLNVLLSTLLSFLL